MNYSERLARLRRQLETLPCDALLIEKPVNLLYLTGLELSTGKLLISQSSACLIVDGRYSERASTDQTLYPVILLKERALEEWLTSCNVHHLGFDRTTTTYQEFIVLKGLAGVLKLKGYELEIHPIESVLEHLRLIKDEDEIALLRAAGHLGYQGYEYSVSLLREGITESEIALELEFFWKKKGASRLAFDSIIAFGSNGSMPHYRAGQTALTQNTSVLIDIGVVLAHYHSDMTRVVYFGTPPAAIESIYSVVEKAKAAALALCRPGTFVVELDRTARDIIASHGYGDHFTHSLGHGLGLEIHEPPLIRQMGPYSTLPLQSGMVITIEPGIYLPGVGGVRLEDTILITDQGYENLTEPEYGQQ